MAIDPKEFRQVLGHFASGVTITTTVDGGGDYCGLTVNAFSSLSLDPPLVLFCLDNRSTNLEAFRSAGTFAVNILKEEHRPLSDRFARSGGEKFAEGDWRSGPSGVPVLGDALATLVCSVRATHDGGDHTIFVGEVQAIGTEEGLPLLFYRARYSSLAG